MEEQQVEGRAEVLIVLASLSHGEQCQKAGQVVILRREPVAEKRDECRIEHLLGVLPERVSRLAVAVGVHDVAVHERQDVGVGLHILEWVVVHGLIEVDGVERLHLISVVREEKPCILEERALGVGDEIARVELADVGRDVIERLARAGTADNQNIQVSVKFRIELRTMEGETEVLREDEVVVLGLEVAERLALLHGAPTRRTALLASAIVADEGHIAEPEEPDKHAHGKPDEHGVWGHVEMDGVICHERPHGDETVTPVLKELAGIGSHGLPVAVAEIESCTGDESGDKC